jgi:hypothetical protein
VYHKYQLLLHKYQLLLHKYQLLLLFTCSWSSPKLLVLPASSNSIVRRDACRNQQHQQQELVSQQCQSAVSSQL